MPRGFSPRYGPTMVHESIAGGSSGGVDVELKTDVMGQLRDRYRRSLPDKRQLLEQLRDRLRQGEPCGAEIRVPMRQSADLRTAGLPLP